MASLLGRVYYAFKNSHCNRQSIAQIGNYAMSLVNSKHFYSSVLTPYEIVDEDRDQRLIGRVIKNVNQSGSSESNKFFAVVHIAGKQFKITEGDIIVIEGYWPPDCGDKISLDKIMVLGAAEFSLIGRPLIQKDLAKIEATVIEKTLSHTKTHFKKKRRKQYMRINFYRIPQTFLLINSIKITGELNNPASVRGLDNLVFQSI
ncbi:large ribosomal subunit protein bL21m-like [Cylas formicarius]|uniref:large ribosomal subunit protein bL21m-like n=1 Tax=Cylas formicarius TaxID=197179 RepID=UPI00295855BF|nr:large ribosomal subunit protein bL21m-like [Cylas formicarius]XP_060531119.1 large ribosomal subunit protein bL21m-like [Cylas formicarius]XP_060531120.1 large ribosomal subunit protein bL21m-like [Cylas formicarius]